MLDYGGYGYVSFSDLEERRKFLELKENYQYIFLSSDIWKGPILIQPYSYDDDTFGNNDYKLQYVVEHFSTKDLQKLSFSRIIAFDDDQSNQLVKQIANIYISHDDKFNSELKEQLNALKDEETSKEIQRLEQELLQQNKQVASIEKNSNYFDNP
ncbi:unnamed protein product [Rotaria socialis]|uniref:Uncharacterized protein n=1 Tax=Rotaria socialis TaxID=392032 RepID=A0A820ZPD0_9BILA|nr:unnamed protein product [Rotaria socialis]CAF3400123.1 unnamed protein product [Rotaria socialis]CAF3622314.1 unnamed protein product [Rotaria socialis]CAF4282866.1 unnamed protein product [Rotaria socialis]CAF4338327.1 unnamed protein product [Rotaria socialis]